MQCPLCGHKLPPLTAVLARVEEGTECPKCWTRLRRLAEPLLPRKRKEKKRRAQRRRRST
jgi:ribosome-binding protein aMBF1 (putative translation factor)